MSTVRILKIGDLPPHVEAMFDREFQCCVWEDIKDDSAACESVRGVVMRSNFRIDREVIARLPNLGVIATSGVGYDGIPLDYAKEKGIQVANTPSVLNAAVAELAVGLLLSLLRDIPAAHQYVRNGQWRYAPYPVTRDLAKQHVGIVGLGRIGKEIARRLDAFDVTLSYYGRTDQQLAWRFEPDLVALARQCDSLIITAPATPETDKMINAKLLDALGPQGYLVNISRGIVVDEEALLHALETKQIAGAALDVFQGEPDINPRFLALDNVILTPHMGSATHETRTKMAELVIDNLTSFLTTGRVLTPVYQACS